MELNGVRVSRETQGRLQHFAELFQKWAKTINLVAPSTVDDLWRRHIADSAQIFQLHPKPARWVDLGSGGGFPGIITAILLAEQKDGRVDLVESNQKKAAFLRVCLRECEARGAVHAVRIEEAPKIIADCDVISARALAELDMLLDYAAPWVERNKNLRLLLHKGRDYEREVHKARGRWEFDLVKHNSVVESDSVILELTRPRRRI
ncbi:16S rRNA (guanine(527)-N(7))-methyltransferase RsmG [Agrobacterium rhizogenes]|uniref:16S rRNA (guanine(527)-N(7))-methyltransferase RsmG n=1 Tax=Rhizobium rhizogenes TaxID=359 RepID=UPI0015729CB7|nr:16S rRNA (guanine(527)-N(7))-methyltransferase RsmG [Rhizobium rhizogenes]NTG47671.1 16S rRNA (guanine(527)-N(7))-methyltransferase RsmG [Rhizobium rhizogenes]